MATAAGIGASGGAISTNSNLNVFDSIFKNNKAIQVTPTTSAGGGAIFASAGGTEVLVLSSIFELNEASNIGGAAQFQGVSSVDWYNNKEILFGNDAGEDCDGVNVEGKDCFSIGDFSIDVHN